MALTMSGKRSEHGTLTLYWVIRGFAMHDEIWPSAKANDPVYGPLRLIPDTDFARVKILQIKLEGFPDKETADSGYRAGAEYVFNAMGVKADIVWEKVKAGEGNTVALLYEQLKEMAEEKKDTNVNFPIKNASDA